jgi:hypothetical protein
MRLLSLTRAQHPGVEDNRVVAHNPFAMDRKHRRARMLGWWYVCIGGAFILLAARSAIRGDRLWSIGIRSVIAVGFIALAVGTFRGPAR